MAEKHEGSVFVLIDTAEALLARAKTIVADGNSGTAQLDSAVKMVEAATKALDFAKTLGGVSNAEHKSVYARLYGTAPR